MRFSVIHCITLTMVGLTKAQTQTCGVNLVDFEDLKDVSSLGALEGRTPIPNGYGGLNWGNLYGATANIAAQLLLPQGKNFAGSIDLPANTPVNISAIPGRTISPKSIILSTAQRGNLGGLGALGTTSTINVTATFKDRTTAQTTFSFKPPNAVFGVAINAQALQYYQFPCKWTKVVNLSFRPRAENGLNGLLGMALDNFQYADDTAA